MMYSTPTLISAMYRVIVAPKQREGSVPQGTTAVMTSAGTSVMTGARKKSSLSALAGINSSLKINLTASAMGCSMPHGPARLGPMRTWMRASALRS